MKKKSPVFFFFVSTVLLFSFFPTSDAFAEPESTMFVGDKAGILTEEQEKNLENELSAINRQTKIEFAVVTVPSLGGESIEEQSNIMFRSMGLGDKERNDGLLLLISLNDRQFRLEVGYGLEGVLPDITAKKIVSSMTKYFQNKDYYTGISTAIATTAYYLDESEEYTVSYNKELVSEPEEEVSIVTLIIVSMLIVASFFFRRLTGFSTGRFFGRSSGGSFGGGSSGGGGASGRW